jgi:hypothetical protein
MLVCFETPSFAEFFDQDGGSLRLLLPTLMAVNASELNPDPFSSPSPLPISASALKSLAPLINGDDPGAKHSFSVPSLPDTMGLASTV